MKKSMWVLFSLLTLSGKGQNPWGFETMVNSLLKNKGDTISASHLHELPETKAPLLLDARERQEYEVSHLQGARWAGYETFDPDAWQQLEKNTHIVVYCSVGKRSEDVAKMLKDRGFTQVQNLWGGIFDWTNRGYPVVNMHGEPVERVHPYSSFWGIWLNKCEKAYEPR